MFVSNRPLLVIALLTPLSSCSPAASPAQAPPPATATPVPAEPLAAHHHPEAEPPPPQPAPSPEPPARAPALPEDYYISREDCEALAQRYRRVHLKQEQSALGAAPTAEQTGLAEKQADAAGAEWLRACMAIVDTRQPRSNLTCAMKAADLQRFEACMAGAGG